MSRAVDAHVYIGLSGFSYKPWQGPGRFYPASLKHTGFLQYYASRYETVELDGIWYRLPTEQTIQAWLDQTPPHFIFTPKAHRQITHFKRLKLEALVPLTSMLVRLLPLAEQNRLGPILLQLPPNFKRDDDRLHRFLSLLPSTVRWAVEFRHDSWVDAEVEALLRLHGVAWAAVETDERSAEHRPTAPFLYARLRRSEYSEEDLRKWSRRLQQATRDGKDCYVYCKHEDEGSPWEWADRLREMIEN